MMDRKTRDRLERLADRARASEDAAKDDRAARDTAIWEADADGAGLRELAKIARLSVTQVQRIVLTEHKRRQVVELDGEPVGPAIG
jgi:hypothetical protein